MKPIPEEIVEQTWKRMSAQPIEKAESLVNTMQKEQPFALIYLLAVGGDLLNEEERNLLVYLGIVVWQMMKQGEAPLSKVTEDKLEEAEEKNFKMLNSLAGKSERAFQEAALEMIEDYPQVAVLKYVFEALMEEPEEEVEIRDENLGIIAIYLKTIIDCFNQ
jgi:hypothetical protein